MSPQNRRSIAGRDFLMTWQESQSRRAAFQKSVPSRLTEIEGFMPLLQLENAIVDHDPGSTLLRRRKPRIKIPTAFMLRKR